MASLIKNQLVKHLSKFAKNLNPDHISVDVLKGKGELHNIELNEILITEALELPSWLKIQRAICNRVAIKIPWTSLKSQPVTLLIDEIRVDVVMTSDLRNMKPHSGPSLASSYTYDTGGYGFTNKVAEGMSLNINSLEIFFTSEVFGGSLTLNQFRVASCTPFWKPATDLRQTRIREPNLNQVLLFKQVSWQLLRIEASTLGDSIATGYNINAPLRLITSQGRARITVKKSTVDGSVITGRMQIILDDLLWVATLPQVRSAISFYRYLMKLIQTASDFNKTQHAEKILQQSDLAAKMHINMSAKPLQAPINSSAAQLSAVFKQFDVVATSYHFYCGFIDLHICDDSNTDIKYPPNWNFNSGALQVSLSKLACDFYPYHLASRERDYWVYYNDTKCRRWVNQLLDHYYNFFASTTDVESRRFESEWSKLMSQCCVVRLDDLTVYCVSEATTNGKQKKLEKLISADHEILKLPGNLPLIHVEFADYYYGSNSILPIPPSCSHVQINPIRIFVDLKTIRWMSYIYLDLCKTLGLDTSSVEWVPHSDVRVEALMPRIVFPAQTEQNVDKKMPSSLIIQISSYLVTNCLIGETVTNQNKLKSCISELENVELFQRTFDAKSSQKSFRQLPMETEAIKQYLKSLLNFLQCDSIRKQANSASKSSSLNTKESFSRNAFNDVWNFELNPIWIDFASLKTNNPRPTPFFVDSQVSGWALLGNKSDDEVDNATGYIIVQPTAPLKFALDHYQYLFFVDTLEQMSKFMVILNDDARCFYETMEPKSLAVTCLAPLVELTIILPASVAATTPSDSLKLDGSHVLDTSSLENVDVRSISNRIECDRDNFAIQDHVDDSCVDSLVSGIASSSATTMLINQNIPEFTGFSMDNNDTIAFDPPSSTYADDTISVHTDMSDDDQFVVLDNSEPSMFDEIFPRNKERAPTATTTDFGEEATEIQPPNNLQMVDLITKHLQRQVSIVVCKLKQVQLSVTGYDQESYITFRSPFVEMSEATNLTLEEVYKTLNNKSLSSTDRVTCDPNSDYKIKFSVITDGSADPAHLDADVKNVEMNISSSNMAALAEFLEAAPNDETSSSSVVPVRIKVTNAKLNVGDAKNLNSTRLIVSDAWIFQGDKNWQTKDSSETSNRVHELEMENAELRQKLADAKAFVQKLAKNSYDVTL